MVFDLHFHVVRLWLHFLFDYDFLFLFLWLSIWKGPTFKVWVKHRWAIVLISLWWWIAQLTSPVLTRTRTRLFFILLLFLNLHLLDLLLLLLHTTQLIHQLHGHLILLFHSLSMILNHLPLLLFKSLNYLLLLFIIFLL